MDFFPPKKISLGGPGSATLRPKFQVGNCVTWISTIMSMEMFSFLGQAHVAVTEKFTVTNILNVDTQLQFEFCKSIQHLCKYSHKQKSS